MKTGDFNGIIEDGGKTYIVELSVKELKNWLDTVNTKEFNDFRDDLAKTIKHLEKN